MNQNSGNNRLKFQSQDIFRLGIYKTWYSTRIRFTSLIFSSLCKKFNKALNGKYNPVLCVDDTSIIFTNSNLEDFKNHVKTESEFLNKQFKTNKPTMNFDKIHVMQFTAKNSPQIDLDINYTNELISKAYDTKYLGIYFLEKVILSKLHTN